MTNGLVDEGKSEAPKVSVELKEFSSSSVMFS